MVQVLQLCTCTHHLLLPPDGARAGRALHARRLPDATRPGRARSSASRAARADRSRAAATTAIGRAHPRAAAASLQGYAAAARTASNN